MYIKHNCWKWQTAAGAFFVKKYDDITIEKKVKNIHRKLAKIDFPYHIPIANNNDGLVIQKWHEGRSARFDQKEERLAAVDCLQALHETKANIEWHIEPLPRQQLQRKWRARFERFLLNEKELSSYLNKDYETIVQTAYKGLRNMPAAPIQIAETTLLHGDVVHHNFLSTDKGMVLIDFDLAVLGSPIDEMILWLHRALPNVDYDLALLLEEHPYTKICKPQLSYIYYPNELLREWLYILQLDTKEREPFLDYLIPFTKKALQHWPKLIKQIEHY
ncbi:phosphotransferase [Metasolibacillus meyeri]|uniref:Phosphotransferase n=1 Tax=Metasolibacillus meyeri TaxID=1071052 RepID=A0AAW9NKV6_9BACL|nr:phosphotransferase [Metasolibacillus meyeri]MEC1178322.1 phosphotransferase [Metasolibacillus meyeri]